MMMIVAIIIIIIIQNIYRYNKRLIIFQLKF